MTSIFESDVKALIGDALSSEMLDVTLTREVPAVGGDAADPPAPTVQTYACKGIEQTYRVGLIASGLVAATDVQVLILAATLSVEPQSLDRITIRGRTRSIVPLGTGGIPAVESDPARATWLCRCQT